MNTIIITIHEETSSIVMNSPDITLMMKVSLFFVRPTTSTKYNTFNLEARSFSTFNVPSCRKSDFRIITLKFLVSCVMMTFKPF